jgi:tetratricopeptide (TPR) repeat protein
LQEWKQPTTYDEILEFLDQLEFYESDDLDKRYSAEDQERINVFLINLAEEGILPGDEEEKLALEKDIANLLYSKECPFAYASSDCSEFELVPAIFEDSLVYDIVPCGKISRSWKKTKKFIKDHKKEIIIGAVVVVAVTCVVVGVVAASAACTATAAGAATASGSSRKSSETSSIEDVSSSSSTEKLSLETPILKSAMDEQVSSFKENIAREQFFATNQPNEGLSWEEKGRVLGSVFANDSLNALHYQLSSSPDFSRELQNIHLQTSFLAQFEESASPIDVAHVEIDKKFFTECASHFSHPTPNSDFNTLSYIMLGEKALDAGYYEEAVSDFSKAIQSRSLDPLTFLERSVAYFNLGEYELSLEDFQRFTTPTDQIHHTVFELCQGFTETLPKGIYESGKTGLLFTIGSVREPYQTLIQIKDSFCYLFQLAKQDEWGLVGEALVPEIFKLIKEWDELSPHERGERLGYVFGKYGGDITTPGAVAKVANKSTKVARELTMISKNLHKAEGLLLVETAAGVGNTAKIAEVIEAGTQTACFAEELGFTAKEMGQLKQAGKLEATVARNYEHLSLPMKESVALYKEAQGFLKQYAKKPMPEFRVRELIHETGIPTFPRPKGIPEKYLVMISDKGAGMKYVDPKDAGTYVRIMPGKPHSPFPYQQKPYVNQRVNGSSIDKYGNPVLNDSLEAHIPIEEFIYKGSK